MLWIVVGGDELGLVYMMECVCIDCVLDCVIIEV